MTHQPKNSSLTQVALFLIAIFLLVGFPLLGEEFGAEGNQVKRPTPITPDVPKSNIGGLVESKEETDADKKQAERDKKQAQDEAAATAATAQNEELDAERATRKTGIARLVAKLTRSDGTLVPVALLPPLDYTTLKFGNTAEKTIYETIGRYGDFNIKSKSYFPPALTLQEFRKIVARYKVDVVITCILKPTNFDLFLYDKRTPYRIYAHSEVLPETQRYQLTEDLVKEYVKLIVRRTLYAYMQDQYFELPREATSKLLSTDIPTWIANPRNVTAANKELTSRFYFGGAVGGAFSMFQATKGWNSSLIGLQLGLRIFDRFYFDATVETFTYNGLMASFRYMFTSKDTAFKTILGLGAAYCSSEHSINYDLAFMNPMNDFFVTPSVTLVFPLVDFYVKLESHLYIGPKGQFLTLAPGLFFLF